MPNKKGFAPIIALIIIAVVLIAGAYFIQLPTEQSQLKKFSTEDELKAYLKDNSGTSYYDNFAGASLGAMRAGTVTAPAALPTAAEGTTGGAQKSADYSQTNVQVAGVDEADIVKNDGKYIYVVSSDWQNSSVKIIDAYPAENAMIAANISIENASISDIFINGDKLVVFATKYDYFAPFVTGTSEPAAVGGIGIMPPYRQQSPKTVINVYDVTDHAAPVLAKAYEMDGSYYDSRMIGDYVYFITNEPVYDYQNPIIPSAARCGAGCIDVWYFDSPDNNYQFTVIGSFNVNELGDVNTKVFMLGYTQTLYVSQDNIYISYMKQMKYSDFLGKITDFFKNYVPLNVQSEMDAIVADDKFSNDEKMQAVGRVLNEYMQTLSVEEQYALQNRIQNESQSLTEEISKEMDKTIIHRVEISNGSIEYKAQGAVSGTVLNQFSMDEFNGNFRIATTSGQWQSSQSNNMYVLDMGMNTVGKLEDMAKGERIYSVRFLGEKAYMVTFRQVDPLFVIDLSNPASPAVLGFLKIPGVSDYLHPYDETHVIGVGLDATEEGRITGMKLSLFDVSDVANPTEVSKYIIGERGTYSEALYDHKAFLFSRDKNLLVIPVSKYGENWTDYWQGAYVFSLDLANGFALKGTITHNDNVSSYDYQSTITRSLYMDDVLYTVSQRMVKMNSLTDMSEINKVVLSEAEDLGPIVY